MKRLKFKRIENRLESEDILCDKDVVKATIFLTSDMIRWYVIDGNDVPIDSGECNNVEDAKKKVKETIRNCGARIDSEKRKYKA